MTGERDESGRPLDTTVTLRRRPNEELIFNDDVSRFVRDSILVLLAPENIVRMLTLGSHYDISTDMLRL